MSETRKNVVIIGGGAFGVTLARAIAPKLDTTRFKLIVINPRSFFVHIPALIRTNVTSEGTLEKEVLMPYGDFLNGKGEVKIGKVASFTAKTEATPGEVVLEGGERISYAVLILTPGSIWEGPLSIPEDAGDIQSHFNSWRAKIEKARTIVLVGGGAVGIEFAGELKDFYPDKHVTIVHGQDQLMNKAYPAKYRTKLLSRIKKTGTEVVLNDYVDATGPSEDGTISTRKGKNLQADLIIQTRGGRPNTDVIASSLGSDALTPSGHVKILPTFQLPEHPDIFASGDVIDWEEQKQAGKAAGHAAVIAKNIFSLLEGREATTTYKGSSELIVITVGRGGGVSFFGVLWGLVFGDWFSSLVKSKGLLIEMARGNNGLGHM